MVGFAVAMIAALTLAGPASAEPDVEPGKPAKPPKAAKPYPSQAEVDRARTFMEARADAVGQIQAARASAARRVHDAHEAAEVAVERYNGARYEAQLARKAAVKALRQAREARQRVQVQRTGIALLAAQTYSEGAALNGVTTFMTSGGPATVMARHGVAESAGQAMKLRYDAFTRASLAATSAEEAAGAATEQAAALAEQAKTARSVAAFATLGADLAQANAGQVESTLRSDLAKAEQLFRDVAQQRKDALAALKDEDPENDPGPERPLPPAPKAPAAAKVFHGTADSTVRVIPRSYPGPVAKPPAPDAEAAQRAIEFAKEQMGEPYLWAAAGPASWDCSGFTMQAWRQGGGSLVHYSEAQYLASTPISAADLAPGDLIFWQGRQERINHVAMYIGDGEMIHASGDVQAVNITRMDEFAPPDYFARPKLGRAD